MDVYQKLNEEAKQKAKEKEAKQLTLEKQLKVWKARQAELRKVGPSAIDPAFVRRQLDKCDKEIERINQVLNSL